MLLVDSVEWIVLCWWLRSACCRWSVLLWFRVGHVAEEEDAEVDRFSKTTFWISHILKVLKDHLKVAVVVDQSCSSVGVWNMSRKPVDQWLACQLDSLDGVPRNQLLNLLPKRI